jgi:hypothetical protein
LLLPLQLPPPLLQPRRERRPRAAAAAARRHCQRPAAARRRDCREPAGGRRGDVCIRGQVLPLAVVQPARKDPRPHQVPQLGDAFPGRHLAQLVAALEVRKQRRQKRLEVALELARAEAGRDFGEGPPDRLVEVERMLEGGEAGEVGQGREELGDGGWDDGG